MLVTVLTTALILSLTGMAVVEFGFYGRTTAQDGAHTILNRYVVESHVNKALWRVNTFADSLVSYTDGPVTVSYDTTTMRLLVGVSQYDETRAVTADLVEDMHFNHSIATNDSLVLSGYSIGAEPGRTPKGEFRFLPNLDLQYFMDNAVEIHTEDYYVYADGEIQGEGIHVFTGEEPILNSVSMENSTFVFTDEWVYFYKDVVVKAKVEENQLPALVFTNPNSVFTFNKEFWKQDHIEGAIYSAGKVRVKYGYITGPIVANKVTLLSNIDLKDDEHPEYYTWHTGFGSYAAYDWPKVITNWTDHYID
jgi:hypothetical protein